MPKKLRSTNCQTKKFKRIVLRKFSELQKKTDNSMESGKQKVIKMSSRERNRKKRTNSGVENLNLKIQYRISTSDLIKQKNL